MNPFGLASTFADSFRESHPREDGHYKLGNNGLSSWRVRKPSRFVEAPIEGGNIITAEQLIRDRVAAMREILNGGGINFEHESSGALQAAVMSHAQEIIAGIKTDGHEWHVIGNTSTMIAIDKEGDAHIVNAPQNKFRDRDFINYSALGPNTDGGALIEGNEIVGEITGTIPGEIFRDINQSGGGNRTVDELMRHPFVIALIPDEQLRNDYLFSLSILDVLQPSDNGTQSTWIPHDLPPFMMRWIALGLKANAFYPPNLKTVGFDVLMKSKSE